MDFNKLSKVADSIARGKQSVTASGKSVLKEQNPLDALEDRDRIVDSERKTIIIDSEFLKKLSTANRDSRRKFLSHLSDSQRRRVLDGLKKIKDSSASRLGYTLLDDLLANVVFDPSSINTETLDKFVKTQEYCEFPDSVIALIEDVKAGDLNPDNDGISDLLAGLEGSQSRLLQVLDKDIIAELDANDIAELEDSASKHAALYIKTRKLSSILDASKDLLEDFHGRNRSYKQASETYWKAFKQAFDTQYGDEEFYTHNDVVKAISDAVDAMKEVEEEDDEHSEETNALDNMYDNPATDAMGNEVKDVESESIMSLLSEALTSYADGDSSKLDALAKKSLTEETSEEPLPEPDEESEPDLSEDSAEAEKAEDSAIRLARRVLQGKKVNRLVDALKDKVPALNKINLKVTDCCLPYQDCPQVACAVPNIPFTREEYCAVCPPSITPLMSEYLATMDIPSCPPINSCALENGLANINNGQYYYPTISAEDFSNRVNEAEENASLQEIIGSCSVPVNVAMTAAAKCDNLPFIDSRFYKKNLASNSWVFDSDDKPACLVEAPEGNTITRCTESQANYHLFGVPYLVL